MTQWIGPSRGPVTILVPGGGDGWERLAQGIGALGYRVLLLDPGATAGVIERAAETLDDRLTLVLHGEAAMAGALWAATEAHRLTRVILLAPKGLAENEPPPPPTGMFARFRRPHVPQPVLEGAHRALALAGIPVVAIWGEADAEVPLAGVGQLALWNRAAKQEVIAGAGHDLAATHGPSVLAHLQAILREDD